MTAFRLFIFTSFLLAPEASLAEELICLVDTKAVCGSDTCKRTEPLPGERIIISVANRQYRLCDDRNGCQDLELEGARWSGVFRVYEFRSNFLKAQTEEVQPDLTTKPLDRWPFMELRQSFLSAILSWGECSPG